MEIQARERPMNRVAIFLTIASTAYAHDVITTKVGPYRKLRTT